MLSGNDEITRLNSDITTTMNLVVVSSRVFHVLYNMQDMLKHDCYFTNPVNSVIVTGLRQHPCNGL